MALLQQTIRRTASARRADDPAEADGAVGANGVVAATSGEALVQRIGDCLLVCFDHGSLDALRPFARCAPADPTTLTVLVGATDRPTATVRECLRPYLRRLREEGYHTVRLLVADAGREPVAGTPSLARDLAAAARLDVLAPEGGLIQVPGGTVFPLTPDGVGTWRRFPRRGGASEVVGPWDTAARWRSLLSGVRLGVRHGLRVHAVPAGLLVLSEDGDPPSGDDLVHCCPVDPDRPLVIVGRLPGAAVGARQLAAFVRSLPSALGQAALFAPYGGEPVEDQPWAQTLADVLGAEVHALTGIPLLSNDAVRVAVVTATGTPAWLPFALELRHAPTGPTGPQPPTVRRWRAPGGLPPCGPRMFRVTRDWVVEVVPCGLWLRPVAADGDAEARAVPFDPGGPTLVVGAPGVAPDSEVWEHSDALLREIAGDCGEQGRLLVPEAFGADDVASAEEIARRHGLRLMRGGIPAPQAPQVVGPPPVAPQPIAPQPIAVDPSDHATVGGAAAPDRLLDRQDGDVEPVLLLPAEGGARPGAGLRHRATAEDRAYFRKAAGTWLAAPPPGVAELVAQVPSPDEDAARVDLLALLAYLADRRRVDAALRGADDPGALRHAVCAASGLGRLPSHQGVALFHQPLTAEQLAGYEPGAVLTAWTFVEAWASTAVTPGEGEGVEFAVWSTTGRRTAALTDDPDRVMFPPGAHFVVLDVQPADARHGGVHGRTRVLLRHLTQPPAPGRDAESARRWDALVLGRLTAALAERDGRASHGRGVEG